MGADTERRLRIDVLGPLRAWRGANPLDLGPAKRQAVLAALLLRDGAVVSHDRLLYAVWGSEPPATGASVLASHINPLRRTLDAAGVRHTGSVIRSGKGWYRFDVEEVRLDLADVTERAARALLTKASGDMATAADQLGEALALFAGEPLAHLPGPFAQAERDRLTQRWRSLRRDRLDCLVTLGRFGDALDDLAVMSPSDGYDESLLALRMRALYGCGRQAEALKVYADTRVRLREELGVDPGDELRRVHQAVLRRDDAALGRPSPGSGPARSTPSRGGAPERSGSPSSRGTPRVPAELPHDTAGFAGREEELAALEALLPPQGADPARTVVISAIGGAAGIGKTALAVHWAHRVRDRFPDGQLYVNLHGFDHDRPPLTAGEALSLLLRSLGLDASDIPVDREDQARVYRTLLAGRRLLVLLDNAASADQVRPLLPGSPSCCVVVTSRNRLGDLVARDGSHSLPLDVLHPADSLVLLSRALGAPRVAAEPEAADELIRLCGSLPLALRVAAARLAGDPGLRLADLVAELSEGSRLEVLEDQENDASPLRTAFSVSYLALAPGARRLFRLLGLFPGPDITTDVAAALLDVPPAQARRLLSALVAAHLVEPAAAGRYGFHDLLREYARERALAEEAAAERDAALRRAMLWYLGAARSAGGSWLFPELPRDLVRSSRQSLPSGPEAAPWLDAERANLLALIHHAGRNGPRPVAWHLTNALFGYFWLHLPRATWQDAAQSALDAAVAEGDLLGQAAMHSSLGLLTSDRGHAQESMGHHLRVRTISGELGWREGEAASLGGMALTEWAMARLPSAYDHVTTGLRMIRDTGNRHLEALGLVVLGVTCRDLGLLHEAAANLEAAIARNEDIGWSDHSLALQNLGLVYWELGRFQDGLDALGPRLATGDLDGHRSDRAMMLDAVARIALERGDHEAASEHAARALAVCGSRGRPWIQVGILTTTAACHRERGHLDLSERAGREALALARRSRYRRGEADCLLGLALTHQRLGRYDDARRDAEQALALARRHSFRVVEGQALTALSATAESEAAFDTAAAHAEDALTIHRRTGHRLGEARTLLILDRLLRDTDTPAESRRRQAQFIFSDTGVPTSQ
ncbi:BTAD domain-containing putative transcriptional regulator [Streptomyces wedmorensis]|uniref:BTAD domain-containing putative transcriptional regulator n=1 Tax=Streptomyces wedmorensis TaxID=43759 RepID=A0ABW6J330_STRWE